MSSVCNFGWGQAKQAAKPVASFERHGCGQVPTDYLRASGSTASVVYLMAGKGKQLSDQGKRFVETARELGCDEDQEAFDQAQGKVASSPPPKTVQKRKDKKPAK